MTLLTLPLRLGDVNIFDLGGRQVGSCDEDGEDETQDKIGWRGGAGFQRDRREIWQSFHILVEEDNMQTNKQREGSQFILKYSL